MRRRCAGVLLLTFACGVQRAAPPSAAPAPTTLGSVTTAPAASAPGAGSCGPASCDYASETCCEADSDRRAMTGCVKKALAPPDNAHRCYGPRAEDWIGIECLSSSDCQSPERCCALTSSNPPVNHCARECEERVACVPGKANGCREGFRCHPNEASRSGGVCLVAAPGTSCGERVCSGATPACCYDSKTKQARCVAVAPESYTVDDPVCPLSEHTAFLECTSPADCGGEHCCTAGPVDRTGCSGMCMTGTWTCRSVQDCPPFIGPPTGCAADPKLPFLKTCQYATGAARP